MTKALLLVALLGGSALADARTTSLAFTLSTGKDARHYSLKLTPDSCGTAFLKAPQQEDEIKVCLKPKGPSDVQLEIDWRTRRADQEMRNSSSVMSSPGQHFELEEGAAKLEVAVS